MTKHLVILVWKMAKKHNCECNNVVTPEVLIIERRSLFFALMHILYKNNIALFQLLNAIAMWLLQYYIIS